MATSSRNAFLVLVTGNDLPGIEAAARKAVEQFAGVNPPGEALESYRESAERVATVVFADAIGALLAPPFLVAEKTVWLHLESGFPEEEGSRGEKAAGAALMARLVELIRKGIAPSIRLVLSGPQDAKKPLTNLPAVVEEVGGRVQRCHRPEFNSREWRSQMATIIAARARAKGLELRPEGLDYLISCLGTDTGRLEGELEKVYCYLGRPGPVTLADLQAVCQGDGEATDWSLLDAVRRRRFPALWSELSTRLAMEKQPDNVVLRLLGVLHREFSTQLQILLFAQSRGLRKVEQVPAAVAALSPAQKAAAIEAGFAFLADPRAWILKNNVQNLGAYKGHELTQFIPLVRDAWWAVISGQVTDKRLILENLILRLAAPG